MARINSTSSWIFIRTYNMESSFDVWLLVLSKCKYWDSY